MAVGLKLVQKSLLTKQRVDKDHFMVRPNDEVSGRSRELLVLVLDIAKSADEHLAAPFKWLLMFGHVIPPPKANSRRIFANYTGSEIMLNSRE